MSRIDRRIGVLFLAFVFLLTIAMAKATYLGAVRSSKLKQDATTQQVTDVDVPAERGTIIDRNGIELAISESAEDVAADPYLITDPHGVATKRPFSRQRRIPQSCSWTSCFPI